MPFTPERLGLARRRRGLTRAALEEACGIPRSSLVSYEMDKRTPKPEAVARLAKALDFPEAFFYGPRLDEQSFDGVSFRAHSRLSVSQREQALAAGALALALSDWVADRFDIPAPDIPTYTGIDPEVAVGSVRSEWGLGELPIGNVIHLLEAHGVRVFSLAEESRRLDAFSFWRRGIPYVFLNCMKSTERTRMDAAHELGHLVLHARGKAAGREAENQASAFASAFLMPKGSVLANAPGNGTLQQLVQAKRRWKVSVAALVYRMHKIGLLTDWRYHRLFIEMGREGYRTVEPDSGLGESSQVLTKVFAGLRGKGWSMSRVAKELLITTEELNTLVFGLVLASAPRRS